MQKRAKNIPKEDTINERLRELTAETRKLVAELRSFVGGDQSTDKTRSLARDLPSLNRRKKVR